MAAPWRLILDERGFDGAWNMALDRAIQVSHARGESPPTLRLYGWARPTVTLGRFQQASDVDLGYCADTGIDVARRATGGRGVLHDDEVTYSVVAGTADGVPRGTTASYRYLCAALVQAFQELGVPAALTSRPRGERSSAACYLHATHADVSLGALKLSGSAQVWHHDTVLQHGSFVLRRDLDREATVFGLTSQDRHALATSSATLAAILGDAPPRQSVIAAVCAAFEEALGVRLEHDGVQPDEYVLAANLLEETSILVHKAVRP